MGQWCKDAFQVIKAIVEILQNPDREVFWIDPAAEINLSIPVDAGIAESIQVVACTQEPEDLQFRFAGD